MNSEIKIKYTKTGLRIKGPFDFALRPDEQGTEVYKSELEAARKYWNDEFFESPIHRTLEDLNYFSSLNALVATFNLVPFNIKSIRPLKEDEKVEKFLCTVLINKTWYEVTSPNILAFKSRLVSPQRENESLF